jgi:hypothetical protein
MFASTQLSSTLRAWHDFFLLVGGASATLLGLMFLSVALVIGLPALPEDRDLFASPVVTQFMYAITLSALCLAPWQDVQAFGAIVTLIGLAALVQSIRRIYRMRRFQLATRRATISVWFHIVLGPLAADALCTASGMELLRADLRAVAGVAAVVIAHDLIGLRNAWNLFIWILEQHHHHSSRAASGNERQ